MAAASVTLQTDGMVLFVSRNPAEPLKLVKFPTKLPQRRYSVVATTDLQALICVEHEAGRCDRID